jgi:hypothetical protein
MIEERGRGEKNGKRVSRWQNYGGEVTEKCGASSNLKAQDHTSVAWLFAQVGTSLAMCRRLAVHVGE